MLMTHLPKASAKICAFLIFQSPRKIF